MGQSAVACRSAAPAVCGSATEARGDAAGDDDVKRVVSQAEVNAVSSQAPVGDEKRCPVSGQAGAEGDCPFARPKGEALIDEEDATEETALPAEDAASSDAPAEVDGGAADGASPSDRGPAAMTGVDAVAAREDLDGGDNARATVEAAVPKPEKPKRSPVGKAKAAPKAKAGGRAGAGGGAKKAAKPTAPPPESDSSEDDKGVGGGCPSSKKDKEFERELRKVKKRMKENLSPEQVDKMSAPHPWLNTQISESERSLKKEMFLSFYREQFAALKAKSKPDMEQYTDEAVDGLKVTGGHRPMARPKNVSVPKDFRKPVGVLTAEQLATYDSEAKRLLICLHGDLFDVSDRPDKYGADAPYAFMTGHDLTWGFVCGSDSELELDKYYDVFKIQPQEKADRKLQGLMSWWAFYEKEYGAPVGRLDVYDKEWELPPPPVEDIEAGCSVM